MVATVPLDARQQAQLAEAARGVEWYLRDPVASAVMGRRAFYEQLARGLGAYTTTVLGPDLIAKHAACVPGENELAGVLRGLSAGRYQLVPWWADERAAAAGDVSAAQLAVARGGSSMGLFPLAAIAIVGVVVAVAGGLWVLADLYFTAQETAAKADLVRAETAKRVTEAVAKVSATDPQAGVQLAAALTSANQAAQGAQPSMFERIGSAVGGGASLAGLLLLGYFLLKHRARGQA